MAGVGRRSGGNRSVEDMGSDLAVGETRVVQSKITEM